MSNRSQTEATTAESDAAKLALVGGFIGVVLGSYRGRAGILVGGLVGGTLGYAAGSRTSPSAETTEDPVVVTIDDTDGTDTPAE